VSGLSGLRQLTSLNLDRCKSLTDVSVLSELSQLTFLGLGWCESLTDVSGLSELSQLTYLFLSGCKSLTNVSGLSGPSKLTSLDLSGCESLTDVSGLSELSQLTSLDLSGCESLTDVSGLSELSQLTSLDLSDCTSLTDVSVLSELNQLTSLDLSGCGSLTDVSGLSGLRQLTSLNLNRCKSLTDVSGLSGLSQLTSLDLSGCSGIRTVITLSSLSKLSKLDIEGLSRLRSIEPLRDVAALRDLSGFHPAVVAELLTHTAVLRSDINYISEKSGDWLQEALAFTDGERSEKEGFAATLGEAFSLLGEHDIVPRYESFLDSHPEFSATPWKAWLQGCAKHQGHEVLVQRVERVEAVLLSPGAVGGISASLPSDDAPNAYQNWARKWLQDMETSWQAHARELLPVSAEVCLAYARLGMKEALRRWLDRFTDPSDPAALDPVQAALGRWQLNHGQIEDAMEHAMAVQQSATRDPLLAAIVEASYRNAATKAGELLLMIESESLRGELAVKLVQEAGFAASAVNMERLIVACGHSVEDLARLIAHAAPEADTAHLQSLSERLKQSPQAAKDLQRTLIRKLLKELSI